MTDTSPPTDRESLPEGWLDANEQLKWLRQRMMFNNPDFVLQDWDCKYVNMRIDMRTGAAILSPGNRLPDEPRDGLPKEVRRFLESVVTFPFHPWAKDMSVKAASLLAAFPETKEG